ncbi:MAG: TlpA family protein disulfide reductase [Bryobacterales bacterium]|nr:TlpA family protein disulfide reductase [Bryobacterales bacterium]
MFGRRKKTLLAAGAKAPSFQLTGLDGSTRSLEDILDNGPALLAFFKISCPVCQLTAPYLDRLTGKNGLQVIGISQDDDGPTRGFMQRFGVTFPALLDSSNENYPASNAYGITSVPSLFLLEPDGTIARCFSGFSKRDLEEIGARAGIPLFGPDDQVPEWKSG